MEIKPNDFQIQKTFKLRWCDNGSNDSKKLTTLAQTSGRNKIDNGSAILRSALKGSNKQESAAPLRHVSQFMQNQIKAKGPAAQSSPRKAQSTEPQKKQAGARQFQLKESQAQNTLKRQKNEFSLQNQRVNTAQPKQPPQRPQSGSSMTQKRVENNKQNLNEYSSNSLGQSLNKRPPSAGPSFGTGMPSTLNNSLQEPPEQDNIQNSSSVTQKNQSFQQEANQFSQSIQPNVLKPQTGPKFQNKTFKREPTPMSRNTQKSRPESAPRPSLRGESPSTQNNNSNTLQSRQQAHGKIRNVYNLHNSSSSVKSLKNPPQVVLWQPLKERGGPIKATMEGLQAQTSYSQGQRQGQNAGQQQGKVGSQQQQGERKVVPRSGQNAGYRPPSPTPDKRGGTRGPYMNRVLDMKKYK